MDIEFERSVKWNFQPKIERIHHFGVDWQSRAVCLYEESLSFVPYGEDIIQEYVMFILQVPFSKGMCPQALMVLAFRCARILEKGFGFVVGENPWSAAPDIYTGVALICSFFEVSSGLVQVENNFGDYDKAICKRKFDKIHRSRTSDIRFKDLNNENHLNVEQLDLFTTCLERLGHCYEQDAAVFKLALLRYLCPKHFSRRDELCEIFDSSKAGKGFIRWTDCLNRAANVIGSIIQDKEITMAQLEGCHEFY